MTYTKSLSSVPGDAHDLAGDRDDDHSEDLRRDIGETDLPRLQSRHLMQEAGIYSSGDPFTCWPSFGDISICFPSCSMVQRFYFLNVFNLIRCLSVSYVFHSFHSNVYIVFHSLIQEIKKSSTLGQLGEGKRTYTWTYRCRSMCSERAVFSTCFGLCPLCFFSNKNAFWVNLLLKNLFLKNLCDCGCPFFVPEFTDPDRSVQLPANAPRSLQIQWPLARKAMLCIVLLFRKGVRRGLQR